MAKLGEVCKVSPSTKNIERQGAWLLNLDMVEQQTGRVIEYKYVGEDDLNGSIIQFDTENVLYSKLRPNLNKVVLPQKDGFSTSELLPLRPDARVLNRDYLAVFLRSDSFVTWAVSKTAGAKMPRLGTKDLMSAEIPVPTIEQQKKIAEKFKKLEQLISLRKQQLAKLDELVKARFVEMFGDPIGNTKNLPVTKFVDVVKMQRGFDLPVQERKSDGMIPIYGSNGVLGYHDISKVKGGGVITGRSGTIGKVFYEKGEFWPLNTTLFSLNSHGNDVVYLKYLLELFDLSRFTEGTGVPTLNRNKFHDELIIDVPLDEQERFAAFVERVDQQKQTVQQSLEKLELMKKALMQEYFG